MSRTSEPESAPGKDNGVVVDVGRCWSTTECRLTLSPASENSVPQRMTVKTDGDTVRTMRLSPSHMGSLKRRSTRTRERGCGTTHRADPERLGPSCLLGKDPEGSERLGGTRWRQTVGHRERHGSRSWTLGEEEPGRGETPAVQRSSWASSTLLHTAPTAWSAAHTDHQEEV